MASLRHSIPLLALACVLSSNVGCEDSSSGDDDSDDDTRAGSTSGGSSANAGRGGSAPVAGNPAGGNDAGAGNEAGTPHQAGGSGGAGGEGAGGSGGEETLPPAEGIYVVGGYLTSTDAWLGYLAVVDDISAQGSIDLERVVEFPDDMAFASPGNGEVYVGNGSAPEIQRWVVEGDELKLEESVGLSQYGIATGLGIKDPIHFLAPDRAYFIDGRTLQVVVWNPQTMQTTGSFSIEGFQEEDLFLGLNFVHRDGDRLLLSARYWRPDDTAALLTRVAIIDTTNDGVTYADDTRCGNIAFHAHDSENNLYLATHPAQTATIAVGTAGAPVAHSCIIRFKSGADEFDPDYYVDLDELAEGHAGGIMQGAGNQAFVMKYAGPDLTIDNYAKAHTRSSWEIHSLTLGDEAATFEKVPGVELQSAYGLAFTTVVDRKRRPYVIAVEGDFTEGAYYDVSTPGRFERALTVPGFPAKAILVR